MKVQCKMKCNYGNKGDIVEISAKELTDRQKVMLKEYAEPEVKKAHAKQTAKSDDKK